MARHKLGGRMRVTVVMFFMFLGLGSSIFASPNYTGTQGDFKIFNVGDTRDSVLRKLSYLAEKGEVTEVAGAERFLSEAVGERVACSFRYQKPLIGKERVRQIVVDFYKHPFTPAQFETEAREFTKYLLSMLEKNYGPPLYSRPYLFLSQLKDNQEKYIAKWVAPSKIVGLAFNRNQDILSVRIIISSMLLYQDLKKDEIQDFN
jgi:hypothetical protein